MAIDPRAIFNMLLAGTGARVGQMGMEGLTPPGATAPPSAFGAPARAPQIGMTSGVPGMFERTPGLASAVRRRMSHRHNRAATAPVKAIPSPIVPGTRKGLTTLKGA